jgi:prolyl oligopeptidase
MLAVHHGWTSTDVYFRDTKRPPAKKDDWTPLVVGNQAHYRVDTFKDKIYVHTDEGAPRWRVFEVDPARPERAAWKEIVPERSDATLEAMSIIGGRLALSYLKNASSLLEVRELDGKLVREVPLPGIGSVGGPIGLPDEDEAYFQFESYTVPPEIYSTSMKTGKTEAYAKTKVPVDPSPFLVEQVFYPSKDGTRISMFIVRRKDLKKDGARACCSPAMAGFLSTETPAFLSSIYPWIERGACSPCRTSGAGANTARSGTRRGCSSRSRTCSTISSLRPST